MDFHMIFNDTMSLKTGNFYFTNRKKLSFRRTISYRDRNLLQPKSLHKPQYGTAKILGAPVFR
jgi:hypothetical protein